MWKKKRWEIEDIKEEILGCLFVIIINYWIFMLYDSYFLKINLNGIFILWNIRVCDIFCVNY